MAKRKKSPVIVTPQLLFGYCWVNKPDSDGQYSDDKFKCTGKIAKGDLKKKTSWKIGKETKTGTFGAFLKWLEKQHLDAGGDKHDRNPVKDGDKPNKKGNKPHEGFMYFTAKSQYQPTQVDANKNPLPKRVFAMSGDVGKLAIVVNYRDDGVNLYLQSVQVLEKNAELSSGHDAFDEEDGFEAEASDDEFEGDGFDDESDDAGAYDDDDEDF